MLSNGEIEFRLREARGGAESHRERARPAACWSRSVRYKDCWASFSRWKFGKYGARRKKHVYSLLEQHHYLGYERPVGEHLKYLVKARGKLSRAWPGKSATPPEGSRPVPRMERGSARAQRAPAATSWPSTRRAAPHRPRPPGRMARSLRKTGRRSTRFGVLAGDVHRHLTFSRDVLSRGQLEVIGTTAGRGHRVPPGDTAMKADAGLATHRRFRVALSALKRLRMDVNLEVMGPHHSLCMHSAVERIRRRRSRACIACAGGNAACPAHHRRDEERFGTAGKRSRLQMIRVTF